jgi:hypothetical protein
MSSDSDLNTHSEPVRVFQASTQEEAEVIRATLEAAGISAFLSQQSPSPVVGAIDPGVGSAWALGIYVSPADESAAREIINTLPASDEELDAEEQADTTTLQEAERRANAQ